MTNSSENIKDKTYTEKADIKYSSARAESATISENTWLFSGRIQSVSTSRTDGEIKLRIAPREMPDPRDIKSTK